MGVSISVGSAEGANTAQAALAASEEALADLGGDCDLCIVFAGAPHLPAARTALDIVDRTLEPGALIGCGAGGLVAAGREREEGPGLVVWALSAPDARIETHELSSAPVDGGVALGGLPDDPADYGEAMVVLADPSSFSSDALLLHLNEERPGMPVLGGLASATGPASAALMRDGRLLDAGAVACSLSGIEVLPCVSQGAAPVGPEMTITAAEGNLVSELASKPALERLREAIDELEPAERELAGHGLLMGVVIDENQPDYRRGDFLVRPIVGVDPESGVVALADRVRPGQTVRLHVRDAASATEDLDDALRARVLALGDEGAAGALMFTCNGRGRHMFGRADHDAGLVSSALGAPLGGFFCAGEIGPVGGRSFLHGFTATLAIFPRS